MVITNKGLAHQARDLVPMMVFLSHTPTTLGTVGVDYPQRAPYRFASTIATSAARLEVGGTASKTRQSGSARVRRASTPPEGGSIGISRLPSASNHPGCHPTEVAPRIPILRDLQMS